MTATDFSNQYLNIHGLGAHLAIDKVNMENLLEDNNNNGEMAFLSG